MATGEDGGGARPPAGVTFLGIPAVKAQEDSYRLRHPDGSVEGPLGVGVLIRRIYDGVLTGSEGVSKDGNFWIPMMAIPQFREAFDANEPADGRTTLGQSMQDEADRQRAITAANPHNAVTAAVLVRPAPLAESGLGIGTSTERDSFRSGAWSAPADAGLSGQGFARGIAQGPGRLDLAGMSELPLPQGFTNLPGMTEDSGALPVMMDLPRGAGQPTLHTTRGTSTALFDDLDDDPVLPVSSQMGLPRAAGTLPMSAQAFGAGLPVSAAGLPVSAASFPTSAASPPTSSPFPPMSSSFGAGASGFPASLSNSLPGSNPVDDFDLPIPQGSARTIGMSALDAARGPDLPASSRTRGPNLQELGNANLWNDDDLIPGVQPGHSARGAAPVASNATFDFDDDPFADDGAWQKRNEGRDAGAPQSSAFFSDDDLPPAPAAPTPAASPATRAKGGAGKGVRYLAVGAVVVALGAAAAFVLPGLLTGGGW
jgi:hypothetical protein